jgi:hypothetical protein
MPPGDVLTRTQLHTQSFDLLYGRLLLRVSSGPPFGVRNINAPT